MRMMECARERVLESFPNAQIIGLMSPVNDAYGKKGLASAKHRIEMCRLSTLSSDWICVDSWEANEPKNQETIKVLDHIDIRFPHARIMLVCGSDLLQSFNSPGVWADDDVRRILDYAPSVK
jgi:nicotinamide mononucleotide adenylyltransferase